MDFKRFPTQSRAGLNKFALAAVAIAIAGISGCRIPGLRGASPGPTMPDSYSLNNGMPYASDVSLDTSQRVQEEPTPTATAEETEESGAAELRDFLRSVSFSEHVRSKSGDSPESSIEGQRKSDVQEQNLNPVRGELAEASYSGAERTQPLTIEPAFASGDPSAQVPFQLFFDDPMLVGIIDQALSGNQELKILAEEIRIACNETYARSGEYRPFVTLGAGAGLEKSGEHTREGAVEEQLQVAPGRRFPDPLPDFLTAVNVSWEIDIWKRLRNAQRAAAMRYLATREGRIFVTTRLVAELAENYYELLALDARQDILSKTIEIQQQSLQAAIGKKNAGRGTELAVQRFKAEIQKNQSEWSIVRQEIVETENRINFLAGRYPQPVERSQVDFASLHLNTITAGIPSQLLQSRADIREAERQVAAAGLDVAAARARFYPSLSLTAGLGWKAFSTGYLFQTPESLIYGVAGELVGPVINRRAIKAEYCTANAVQLQSVYNYQQTVLQAHIEVVNEITRVENLRRSIVTKQNQLDSLEASVEVASRLFQNARAEYVEVLLAQRELMEARTELIDIKRQQLTAIVRAYQALGGGRF